MNPNNISILDQFKLFIDNNEILRKFSLGLAKIGFSFCNLLGKAVTWIKECFGITKKTNTIAQEVLAQQTQSQADELEVDNSYTLFPPLSKYTPSLNLKAKLETAISQIQPKENTVLEGVSASSHETVSEEVRPNNEGEKEATKQKLQKRFQLNDAKLQQQFVPKSKENLTIDARGIETLFSKYPDIVNLLDRTGSKIVWYWVKKSLENGLPLLQQNPQLNDQFKQQLSHILAHCEKNNDHKTLKELAEGFQHCQPEQQRCVSEIYERLIGITLSFEDQMMAEAQNFKEKCCDEIIWTLHPSCGSVGDENPNGQFAHIKSAYLSALGEELGLKDASAAKLDQNKPHLTQTQKDEFKKAFNQKVNNSVVDFAINLANKWNTEGIANNNHVFNAWLNENAGSLQAKRGNFAFYNEDYEADYLLLPAKPTEEQKSMSKMYFSPIDVFEILKLAKVVNDSVDKV
jgi:hypothetical protein